MHSNNREKIGKSITDSLLDYPPVLLQALVRVGVRVQTNLYMVGGTVRDHLLGVRSKDLDIAVGESAKLCAGLLCEELGGGAIVDLSGPEDEACRVVWQCEQIDFATFRGGVTTIEEDLLQRDFTINSMAVNLSLLLLQKQENSNPPLIDPAGGLLDLRNGHIRHLSGAFIADPARLVRGFRHFACFGFEFTNSTLREIENSAPLIASIAVERIHYELAEIFASKRTWATLKLMDRTGLLQHIVPELYLGSGVLQPAFHHLDVFDHNFLALEIMEKIIANPDQYFPGFGKLISSYLQQSERVKGLKWAALLHDIGKPATRKEPREKSKNEESAGRVTFYCHDKVGKDMFTTFSKRCKWSRAETDLTGRLIGMHMHPFHLCNVQRNVPRDNQRNKQQSGQLSKKAALKISQKAGDELIGLFLLAMADSLASRGEKKPENMEGELVSLLSDILEIYRKSIEPVLQGARLLSGRDLIEIFSLEPGPLFREIFEALEIARVEGEVRDRQTAIGWTKVFLASRKEQKNILD